MGYQEFCEDFAVYGDAYQEHVEHESGCDYWEEVARVEGGDKVMDSLYAEVRRLEKERDEYIASGLFAAADDREAQIKDIRESF
jgi:hypothetical protein